MKKCSEHAEGKPCVLVIAEGNCRKEKCKLFPKVLRIIPKLKNMREAQAKGLILSTVWDFSEKAEQKRQKEKKVAEKWLSDLYPRIKQNLEGYL